MSESKQKILVVDDEAPIRRLLRRCLEREAFDIVEAQNKAEAHEQLQAHAIDLITLDLSLGGEDGLELAREIRTTSQVPIIMVSGKGELIDTVVGLEVGADDYISKPFEAREVVARVRAVLRRYQNVADQSTTEAAVTTDERHAFENWVLNSTTRELYDTEGTIVPLTTGEYDLLHVFVTHARKVLSRDQIMDALKGSEWLPNDRTIDNQVARLRKKLELKDSEQQLIKTVRGAGYLFTVSVESS